MNVETLIHDTEFADAVFTSPPYPNEKDYTRTTRLELALLDYINDLEDLRNIKKSFVRSNTRSIYKADDDHLHVHNNERVQDLAKKIEERRIELGKTSGFEKQYHKVVLQYFGGMKRHLGNLRNVLKPGARLCYVVGDQASYLRIMINTGEILERLFFRKYEQAATRVRFEREELTQVAEELGLAPIKNLGDVVYGFNYRLPVPDSMAKLAPQHHQGKSWVIRHVGRHRANRNRRSLCGYQ